MDDYRREYLEWEVRRQQGRPPSGPSYTGQYDGSGGFWFVLILVCCIIALLAR